MKHGHSMLFWLWALRRVRGGVGVRRLLAVLYCPIQGSFRLEDGSGRRSGGFPHQLLEFVSLLCAKLLQQEG